MTRALFFMLAVVCASCGGSPQLRGGSTLAAGSASSGVAIDAWAPKDCRDAKGASAERASRIELVKLPGGARVLVEQRQGYDSLVVRNSFVEGAEVVYQVIIKPADGQLALHEFRLPNAGGKGRLSVARRWRQVESSEHRFRGYVESPVVTCSLEPQARPSTKPARQSASAGQYPRP